MGRRSRGRNMEFLVYGWNLLTGEVDVSLVSFLQRHAGIPNLETISEGRATES